MSTSNVVERLAEAVVDQRQVDWEVELASHPAAARPLRSLRVIEQLGSACRGVANPDVTSSVGAGSPLPAAADVAPVHWGPLEIVAPLGRGGFGTVYRAFDPKLRREVALKLHHAPGGPDDAERFLDEARRLARVRHPNVLAVHGAGRFEGRPGLWTDLLEGETLEQVLARQGPFGAEEAVLIGVDLCRALAAVHRGGLLHRDIKTANVMRERGGRIVLMDFGAGRELAQNLEAISGTPLFMAPECLLDGTSSVESDLYSLGVVLYRLVTARFPVTAGTLPELIGRHRQGVRFALTDARSDLPTAFVRVVERAIDPDPGRRFHSAGEMERALQAGLTGDLVDPRPGRSGWLRSVGLAAGLSALVVTAVFLLLSRSWRDAASPFAPSASLYLLRDGQEVEIGEETRVREGDRLRLELDGAGPVWVYVINEDDTGSTHVLFPLAALDRQNPLSGDGPHRLPGSAGGVPRTWEVSTEGAHETFLVVASKRRIESLETELARLPHVGEHDPASRGVERLAPADSALGVGSGSALYRLAGQVEELGRTEVWTSLIRVRHATPALQPSP